MELCKEITFCMIYFEIGLKLDFGHNTLLFYFLINLDNILCVIGKHQPRGANHQVNRLISDGDGWNEVCEQF